MFAPNEMDGLVEPFRYDKCILGVKPLWSVHVKLKVKQISLLAVALWLASMPTVSQADVDYMCQSNCIAKGYMFDYCQQQCSYNSQPLIPSKKTKQTDYKCQSDCMSRGYLFDYCESRCSY